MKIGILTFYSSEYQPLADVVIPNRDAYCELYGYEHVVKLGPYKDASEYYAIDRMVFLRDFLFENPDSPDVVFLMALNNYIMNYTKKLEDFLTDEKDFFITADSNGLNTGIFAIRKTEWSKKWLDFVIEKSLTIDHHWYEQKVVMDHANDETWREKIKILPQNSFNSYDYRLYKMPATTEGQFKKGDFIFHAPGIAYWENCSLLEFRVRLFKGGWVQRNFIGKQSEPTMRKSVSDFYKKENNPEYYKKYNEEHRSRFDFLFKEFDLANVRDLKVADFGGGVSELLIRLHPSNEKHCFDGAQLSGIDLPFEYHPTDLDQNIDWPDSYFQLSIVTETLEHLSSPYKLIEEIKRMTRIGGRVLITIPDARMEHNSPYFPLFYPESNFESWLDQMALPRLHKAFFDGAWPSWCYLCENRPWFEKKLPFPKAEAKFRDATQLDASNI
jgi:SAM-dependent methyltransferase